MQDAQGVSTSPFLIYSTEFKNASCLVESTAQTSLMPDFFHLLQWPAMAVSLLGAWWIGDKASKKRHFGFAVLFLSNALWSAWAISDHAWALLVMQVAFVVLNGRGFYESFKGRGKD